MSEFKPLTNGNKSPLNDLDEVKRAGINPAFLVSNATAHRWVLGAVAEIVDNAVDEHASSGATRAGAYTSSQFSST